MKYAISTPNAPQAIGPYSQAVVAGDFVFVSGSIPLNPATGEIVPGGIKEQTTRVFENLKAILEEAKLSFDSVVKATVLLADINDFATVNDIYAAYFTGEVLPARAAYQVSNLPKGVMVEIELIAYKGE